MITVAARRMTDLLRSEQARRREDTVARQTPPAERFAAGADEPGSSDSYDTLVLLLMCSHPALSAASQVALTCGRLAD